MKYQSTILAIVLSGITGSSFAAGAGDSVVTAGWLHLDPGFTGDPLQVTAMGQTQTIPGTSTNLSKVDTAAATIGHFFTDHIMAETILGMPPTVHLNGTGSLSAAGELGTAKLVAPAVLAKYYFGEKDDTLRPYVGLGLSYVSFTDVKLDPFVASGSFLASPSTGNALVGPTTATMKSTFSPLLHTGLSYNFSKRWSAGVNFTYAPVHGKATLTTQSSSAGTVTTIEKFTMNSVNSYVSVGYTF